MKSKPKDTKSLPRIRLTIPDLPPAEQLEMVEDWIKIVKTFAEVSGEQDQIDLSEAYAARDKLIDLANTCPEATTNSANPPGTNPINTEVRL